MGPLGCTVVFKVVVLQRIRNENGILNSGDTLNCAYCSQFRLFCKSF